MSEVIGKRTPQNATVHLRGKHRQASVDPIAIRVHSRGSNNNRAQRPSAALRAPARSFFLRFGAVLLFGKNYTNGKDR